VHRSQQPAVASLKTQPSLNTMPSDLQIKCHSFISATSLTLMFGLAACADFEVPALKKIKGADKPAEAVTPKVGDKKADGTTLTKDDIEILRLKAKMNADAIATERVLQLASGSSVDLSFLLSMNYEEAKSISAHSLEMPNGLRIAADSIEVIKKDGDDVPKRVSAKGKVYLENGVGEDMAKVLCQEVYISSREIVLRGKPIIQRGGSTIEGLEDRTVAYMIGTRLRVLGLHRLTNQNSMIADLPDLGPWTGGPNPLLPPLTEASVPTDVRDQMMKAAEAEAVLQQNRTEALTQPAAPPAPWVKPDPKAKLEPKPAPIKPDSKIKETTPPAPEEKPKATSKKKAEKKAA